MKVIEKNATAALFEKAEELNNRPTDGWKCIYFKIPDAQERKIHSLPDCDANVIANMLERMKGFAYFCSNGEIFVLYKGNYNSLTTRLSMYLWTLYPEEMSARANHKLFSFFDLSKDWSNFYRLCEKRYVDMLASTEVAAMFSRERQMPLAAQVHDHVAGYLMSK